jgi:DNA-binding MarR family transcriptional regulator
MSPPEELTHALRLWFEIFFHRSMCDFKHFMSETGLSFPLFSILMRLYHGEPGGISEMGDKLGVTRAAASQAVERLVQLGLVTRQEDTSDRRMRRLALTPAGRALVEQAIDARCRWLESLAERLTPEQHALIVSALTLLTEAARAVEE